MFTAAFRENVLTVHDASYADNITKNFISGTVQVILSA
jgi:hypothetical protein